MGVHKMKQSVPVFFAINDEYVEHCCTTIVSIMKNSRLPKVNIYILIDTISLDSKELFAQLELMHPHLTIELQIMPSDLLDSQETKEGYNAGCTFYRFVIADLFPEWDKALYLDADMIVNGDIASLCNMDMEGFYCAGVSDVSIIEQLGYKEGIGLEEKDMYINTGVLLLNLKQWRDENVRDQLLLYASVHTGREHWQDVLNIVCKNKIKLIPGKYNFTVVDFCHNNDALPEALIIHYAGSIKPWEDNYSWMLLKAFYYHYRGVLSRMVGKVLVRWMERTIHLFQRSRAGDNHLLEEQAEALLERIMELCSATIPTTFGGGSCGIGTGIAYLLQEKFVEGDSDEVLSEIDHAVYVAIHSRSLFTLGLNDGVCGLAYYLYHRLRQREDSDELYVSKMKEHFVYLIDWIGDLLPKVKNVDVLYEAFCMLCLLQQLNVQNSKIEKLMDHTFNTITELRLLGTNLATKKNLILVGNKPPAKEGLNDIIDSFDYVLRIGRMTNLGASGHKLDGIYLEANHVFKYMFKGGENKEEIRKARNIFMHKRWYDDFAEWESYLTVAQYRQVEIVNHRLAIQSIGFERPTSAVLVLSHLLNSPWKDQYNIYITCLDVEGRADLIDNSPFWTYHHGGGIYEEAYLRDLINQAQIIRIEDE